jgi:hypothetical protein
MTDQPVTDEAGESNMDTSIQWRTRTYKNGAAKSGIPIQVAVAIFCKDAAQAVEAYMKWEMTEREFRFSEWEPDDSGY